MRVFQSPDGVSWKVIVQLPSHSGGQLLFKHPDGESSRRDRYAWIHSPVTTDPRERLTAKALLDSLSDEQIARLFRRSMSVSAVRNLVNGNAQLRRFPWG